MARLRISLITPSFNQRRFIERTVESVLCQTGEFDLEYLVLDGGSTDGTLELLRKYEGRLDWTSERDRGQSDAINKGLRRATGDVVGWLNSDDVLLPGTLARVADAFARDPKLEWLHGRCHIIDPDDRVIRRWIAVYKDWCARRYSYARLLQQNFICQMTVFWRRSLLDEVGYLDEDLHLAMDYEYWLRLAKRSDPLYVREPMACFRWYPTSKSGAQYARQFREECAIARKHAPARRWLHLLKRVKTAQAALIYQGLALLQPQAAAGRDGAAAAPASGCSAET